MEESARAAGKSRCRQFRRGPPVSAALSPLVSRRIRQTKLLPAGPRKSRCLRCAFFSSLRFLRARSLPRLGRGVSALSLFLFLFLFQFLFHPLQPELARVC